LDAAQAQRIIMDYYDKLRNYNVFYTKYTCKTRKEPKEDIPIITNAYAEEIIPDYLCLYSERKNYYKTPKTAICFYQYDDTFDGHYGLWESIYYGLDKRLAYFKRRFYGVPLFIEPDYSQIRDIESIENKHRVFKARVADLFFIHEINAVVIPNVTYADRYSFDYMLLGIETCEIVAFSMKGIMRKPYELQLLKEAIIKTVEVCAKLKAVIVYSVSTDESRIKNLFEYAIRKGIKIFVPGNLLQARNRVLNGEETSVGLTHLSRFQAFPLNFLAGKVTDANRSRIAIWILACRKRAFSEVCFAELRLVAVHSLHAINLGS